MSKQEKKKISKKRSFNDMGEWLDTTVNSVINPMDTVLEPYRVSVTQKWSEKVQAASGLAMQKKFKVINQSFSTLFSQLDHDKERLMKRTRLNRGNISIIGTVRFLYCIFPFSTL
jgi:protein AATF/BFR2